MDLLGYLCTYMCACVCIDERAIIARRRRSPSKKKKNMPSEIRVRRKFCARLTMHAYARVRDSPSNRSRSSWVSRPRFRRSLCKIFIVKCSWDARGNKDKDATFAIVCDFSLQFSSALSHSRRRSRTNCGTVVNWSWTENVTKEKRKKSYGKCCYLRKQSLSN